MILKTLEEEMSFYAAYHSNKVNKLFHFVGVPMITFSILVLLGWLRFEIANDFEITLAILLVLAMLGYYFYLDIPLAIGMTLILSLLLYGAELVSQMPIWSTGVMVALLTQVVGWILQLIGHMFEGRKPALLDNFFQVIIAPLFLMAEVFFILGLKHDVRDKVEEMKKAYLPSASVS